MLTQDNINFMRYFFLLVQCGTKILRFLLKKSLKLEKTTLDNLLQDHENEKKIRESKPCQSEMELLYPRPSKVRDTKDWDISLLCFILNKFLTGKLSATDKNALAKIREYRNEISHYPDCAMTNDTFEKQWKSLTCIIESICKDMKPNKRQRKMKRIERIETQIDFRKDISDLELLLRKSSDNLLEQIRALIEPSITEMKTLFLDNNDKLLQEIEELRFRVEKLEKVDPHFIEELEFKIKAVVQTTANDKQTKELAEQYLLKVTEASVEQKVPDSYLEVVKEKFDGFLEAIWKFNCVLTDYREGSVILEFTCQSVVFISDLLKFFYGPEIKRHLNEISESLEAILGKKVKLEVYLLRQPVLDIRQKFRDLEQKGTVEFFITCNGVDGLKRIWDIFEEGEEANSFNELLVALSDAVGKPVRLETSIDLNYLRKSLQEVNTRLVKSSLEEAVKVLRSPTFEQERALSSVIQALDMLITNGFGITRLREDSRDSKDRGKRKNERSKRDDIVKKKYRKGLANIKDNNAI